MASLMLLLEAFMRWHRNLTFSGEGWRGEQPGADGDVRVQGTAVAGGQYYQYSSDFVKEEDEAQACRKIAEVCIWP